MASAPKAAEVQRVRKGSEKPFAFIVGGHRIGQNSNGSTAERLRLHQEVATLRVPLQETLERYERNLGDKEQRRILEGKFRDDGTAYNGKVLSLVKQELAQGKPDAMAH